MAVSILMVGSGPDAASTHEGIREKVLIAVPTMPKRLKSALAE